MNDSKREECGTRQSFMNASQFKNPTARHSSQQRFKESFGLLANQHPGLLSHHLDSQHLTNKSKAEWWLAQAPTSDKKQRRFVQSLVIEKNPFSNDFKRHGGRLSPQNISNYKNWYKYDSANDDGHVVSLDKEQFKQIDEAVKMKFLKFQLEQNIDINLKSKPSQEQMHSSSSRLGSIQQSQILANEIQVAGFTPSDGRVDQDQESESTKEQYLRDCKAKFTEVTPSIRKPEHTTLMSCNSNYDKVDKAEVLHKWAATASKSPGNHDLLAQGRAIPKILTKENSGNLARDMKVKVNKFNRTSDNFYQPFRGKSNKEEPELFEQREGGNFQGRIGRTNMDITQLKVYNKDSLSSHLEATPCKMDPIQEKSLIQTQEIDSAQHSQKIVKRQEEGSNTGMIAKIFSNTEARQKSQNESLPPIKTEMAHHQLQNANDSQRNSKMTNSYLTDNRKKSEPLQLLGQIDSEKLNEDLLALDEERKLTVADKIEQQSSRIQMKRESSIPLGHEDLVQLGLAYPLPANRKIAEIESNNDHSEAQNANQKAIKQEDGSAKPKTGQKLSMSFVNSQSPSIRVSNQIANQDEDEEEQTKLNNDPKTDVRSGVESRDQSVASFVSLEAQQTITNYRPFSNLNPPGMPNQRKDTADLMKSFCLYSHEQMRQIEIKKHLDRKLKMDTKEKDGQQKRDMPSKQRDPSSEVLLGLINLKRKKPPIVEESRKEDQASYATKAMNKFPTKKAIRLNIQLDHRNALRSSIQTIQHSSNASSLAPGKDNRKADAGIRSGSNSTRHGLFNISTSQLSFGLNHQRNKAAQDQVFGKCSSNSRHFINVVQDLATKFEKMNKLKPIKVEKKQMNRFFNNTDMQMMRKTYFQTLRQQGESALQISQSPKNTSQTQLSNSNVVIRVTSKNPSPEQSKTFNQNDLKSCKQVYSKSPTKRAQISGFNHRQIHGTGMSIEFQNILREPTNMNGTQPTNTSASNSRSMTKGYSGFGGQASADCYSLGQTPTASFFNAVYNPKAHNIDGTSERMSKETNKKQIENVYSATNQNSPRSGSNRNPTNFQNTKSSFYNNQQSNQKLQLLPSKVDIGQELSSPMASSKDKMTMNQRKFTPQFFGLPATNVNGVAGQSPSQQMKSMENSPTLNGNGPGQNCSFKVNQQSRNGPGNGMISVNLTNMKINENSEPALKSALAKSNNQTVSLTDEFGTCLVLGDQKNAQSSQGKHPNAMPSQQLQGQHRIEQRGPIQDYSEAENTNTNNYSNQSMHRLDIEAATQIQGKEKPGLSASRNRTTLPVTIAKNCNSDLRSSFKLKTGSAPSDAVLSPKLQSQIGMGKEPDARRQLSLQKVDSNDREILEQKASAMVAEIEKVQKSLEQAEQLQEIERSRERNNRRSSHVDKVRRSRPNEHIQEVARATQLSSYETIGGQQGRQTQSSRNKKDTLPMQIKDSEKLEYQESQKPQAPTILSNPACQLGQILMQPSLKEQLINSKLEEKRQQNMFQAIIPREAKIALAGPLNMERKHQTIQGEPAGEYRRMVQDYQPKWNPYQQSRKARAPSNIESLKRSINGDSCFNNHDNKLMDRKARSPTPVLTGSDGPFPETTITTSKHTHVPINKYAIARILDNQRQSQEQTFQKSGSGSRTDSPTRKASAKNQQEQSLTTSRDLGQTTEKGFETQLLTRQLNTMTGTGNAKQSAEQRSRQILVEVNNNQLSQESSVELSAPEMAPTFKANQQRNDSNPFLKLFKDLQKQQVDLKSQQQNIMNQMFDQERRQFFQDFPSPNDEPAIHQSAAFRSFHLQLSADPQHELNQRQPLLHAHKSSLDELCKSKNGFPNRKAVQSPFTVDSKSLRLGQTVYTEKNTFRTYRKLAVRQVNDLLKDFYEDKVNTLQGGKFNRWTKPVTNEEDALPLDGRDEAVIGKIQTQMAEEKRRERALEVWDGPPLAELVGAHQSQAASHRSKNNSKSPRK